MVTGIAEVDAAACEAPWPSPLPFATSVLPTLTRAESTSEGGSGLVVRDGPASADVETDILNVSMSGSVDLRVRLEADVKGRGSRSLSGEVHVRVSSVSGCWKVQVQGRLPTDVWRRKLLSRGCGRCSKYMDTWQATLDEVMFKVRYCSRVELFAVGRFPRLPEKISALAAAAEPVKSVNSQFDQFQGVRSNRTHWARTRRGIRKRELSLLGMRSDEAINSLTKSHLLLAILPLLKRFSASASRTSHSHSTKISAVSL